MPPERRMTEAEIRRKTNKPIMEKKRRERINNCLEDLKSIVLTSVTEESRPNKLEKADILEMTVRYIKGLKSGTPVTEMPTNQNQDKTNSADQQRKGYEQCMKDVAAFLSGRQQDITPSCRSQLLDHLTDKSKRLPEQTQPVKRKRSYPAQKNSSGGKGQPYAKRLLTELDLRRHAQARLDDSSSFNVTSYLVGDVSCSTQNLSLSSPFSPVPVSPISSPSAVSPDLCRQIPSPTLSSASQRSEDSIGDVLASNSPGSNHELHRRHRHHRHQCSSGASSVFSPVTPIVDRKARRFLVDSGHYHYVSSDSGHWSSGSNPPSPISKPKCQQEAHATAVKVRSAQIKVENPQSNSMWRPWGL